jgi:hypothetical protein
VLTPCFLALQAVEKRFQSISIAMQRAERAAAAAAAAGDRRQDRAEPPRRSGREKHQVRMCVYVCVCVCFECTLRIGRRPAITCLAGMSGSWQTLDGTLVTFVYLCLWPPSFASFPDRWSSSIP